MNTKHTRFGQVKFEIMNTNSGIVHTEDYTDLNGFTISEQTRKYNEMDFIVLEFTPLLLHGQIN